MLGVGLGYNDVDGNFDSGGGVDMRGGSIYLIGNYFRGNHFYTDGLVTYGRNRIETRRDIVYADAGGDVNRSAEGDTDSNQFAGGLGVGLDFATDRWAYGIHSGFNVARTDVDSYEEEGAGGLNLSYTSTPRFGVLVPYVRFDFVHEFENDNEFESVNVANDRFAEDPLSPTNPIGIDTGGADPNYLAWSAGLHAQFVNGISAFVDYRGLAMLDDMDVTEFTFGLRFERRTR